MFYEHCLRKTRVITASRIVGGRFEPITKENENFVRGETTFDIVEYQEKREMSYVFFFCEIAQITCTFQTETSI